MLTAAASSFLLSLSALCSLILPPSCSFVRAAPFVSAYCLLLTVLQYAFAIASMDAPCRVLPYVIFCYAMLSYVTLCYVVFCYVNLCFTLCFTLRYVMLCYVI
jgi:hypothetical protein